MEHKESSCFLQSCGGFSLGVNTSFSYKEGKSFLHRCPAIIKILFIPLISLLLFKLPPAFAAGLFLLQTILAFCLGFTLGEQLCDLKPLLYYAIILLLFKLAGAIFYKNFDFLPSLLMLLKLLGVMQTASLVFKTSTSLQLRQGLENMEKSLRRLFHLKTKTPLSNALALFICFIPQVWQNWEAIKKAWFARGGKKSLRMLIVLLPVLFSLGMKQAYNTARALSVRGCNSD